MNSYRFKVLLSIFAFSLSFICQSQDIYFEIISKKNDCPQYTLTAVNRTKLQEEKNFKWIITNIADIPNRKDSLEITIEDTGKFYITLEAYDKNNILLGTHIDSITLLPPPKVHYIVDRDVICKNNSVTFTPVIESSSSPIKTFMWDFGDENDENDNRELPDNVIVHTYDFGVTSDETTTVIPKLYVEDENGCTNDPETLPTIPITVKLTDAPRPIIKAKESSIVECGNVFEDTLSYANYNGSIESFFWVVDGDTLETTETSILHHFEANESAMTSSSIAIVATDTSGCSSDLTYKSFQLSNPKPPIIIIDTLSHLPIQENVKACMGGYLVSTTPGYSEVEWIFDNDTITGDEFIASLNNSGVKEITVNVTDIYMCPGSNTASIEIEDSLQIEATLDDIWSCSSDIVTIGLQSSIDGSIFYSDIEATITDDALVASLPEGNNIINMWAVSPSGCVSDTLSKEYLVTIPEANFSFNHQGNTCYPLDVEFINTADYSVDTVINGVRIVDSIVKIEWDFKGNDTIDLVETNFADTLDFTYTDTGYFKPTQIITTLNGCVDTTRGKIFVGDTPTVDITIIEDKICASEEATFSYSTNLGEKYDSLFVFMSNEEHQVSNVLMHEKINGDPGLLSGWDTVGIWKPTVKASNKGCFIKKAIDDSILILGPYIATFSEHSCSDPFDEYSFYLIDNDESTEWNWYIDNTLISGSTNKDTIHYTFPSPDDYVITVNAVNDTNSCEFTSNYPAYVRNLDVVYEPSKTLFCQFDTLYIKESELAKSSTGVETDKLAFQWHATAPSGAQETGSVNTGDPIVFKEKGTYTISVSSADINMCMDTASAIFTIYKPHALFNDIVLNGCSPLQVDIENLTEQKENDTTIISTLWYINNTFVSSSFDLSTTVSGNKPQSVSLKVIDAAGCEDIIKADSLLFPVQPDIAINPTEKLCAGADEVPFIYTGKGFVDIKRWDFGNGNIIETADDTVYYNFPDAEGTVPVTFSAIVLTDFGQCQNDYTFDVEVINLKAEIDIFIDERITRNNCSNPKITYNNEIDYSSDPNIYDKWYLNGVLIESNNTTNYVTIPFDATGHYTISLETYSTEYEGCNVATATRAEYIGNIDVDFEIDDTVCVGELIEFTVNNPELLQSLNFEIDYRDGYILPITEMHSYDTIPSPNPKTVKLFSDTYKNCYTIPTKEVYVHTLYADFIINNDPNLNEAEVCTPSDVLFTNNSVFTQGSNISYKWDFGNGETYSEADPDSISYKTSDTYDVSLIIQDDDCIDTAVKEVTLYPSPTLQAEIENDVVCEGSSSAIHVTTEAENVELVWSPTDFLDLTDPFNPIASPDTTFTYIVSISEEKTDNLVCSDSVEVTVPVQKKPSYSGFPNGNLVLMPPKDTIVILEGNGIYINDSYNVNNDSLPDVTYLWEPSYGLSCTNCASPTITGIQNDQIYILTMSNQCFPDVQEIIEFKVIKDSRIKVTTAFTPNGDGMNDFAFARGWGLKEFVWLRIYNRWGQLMFETNNFYEGWDGTYKDIPQNTDTYSYIVKAIDHTDKEIVQKGYVTLIR